MITETAIFKYGLFIESIIIEYLQNVKNYKIIEQYNDTNKYDVIVQDNQQAVLKLEIKGDRQACKTNNFYIEYISHDLPSGIHKTKADVLIYVVEYEDKFLVYWLNIQNLNDYINSNFEKIKIGKSKSIDINNNFNGKFNYGYLIKIDEKIYYQVDEILKSNLM